MDLDILEQKDLGDGRRGMEKMWRGRNGNHKGKGKDGDWGRRRWYGWV